jgi:hypothetical protein
LKRPLLYVIQKNAWVKNSKKQRDNGKKKANTSAILLVKKK